MSATNSTPTINLPIFIGTDKPAWLVDWNGAMNAIDSAIATLQTTESGTASSLAALAQSVTALSNTVSQHTTAIETVAQTTTTLAGNVNTINSLIGNGEPTTTDKTLIGAINEINAKIPEGGEVAADDVTYDNTDSGLTATNVQAAIDELAQGGSGSTVEADDVSYDNTDSGLSATNVQDAIDEVANGKNIIGQRIDLMSYTSFANAYVVPSEGYIAIFPNGTNSTSGQICSADAESAPTSATAIGLGAISGSYAYLPVHKGMKFYISSQTGSDNHAWFYPLS